MRLWDYKIQKGWKPKTDKDWLWYLERKINYDDWQGLNPRILAKFFARLKLPLGKKLMLKAFLKRYASQTHR